MAEYDEIYDEEKIEKDNYKSMRELSKYTKILEKENNLSFILKNHHEIKLYNSKSLYKISMLLGNLPEENVSFTFYADEEDEQSEEKSSKKNILKAPGRPFKRDKKDNENENKKDIESKEEKIIDLYLIDKVKEDCAQEIYKNGNIIGYNHDLFKKIWVNLYLITLFASSIGLLALLIYIFRIIKQQNYLVLGACGLSFISFCLMIFTSYSGKNKMNSKKKVNFNKENSLLILFTILDICCIGYWIYLSKKCSGLKIVTICAYLIFGFLLLMSLILIGLNKKMIDFYREYHKMTEEGTLLIEVQ